MTETRELICINCPLGCGLTVTIKDGEVEKGGSLWKERSDKPYQDRDFHSEGYRRRAAGSLCKDSF